MSNHKINEFSHLFDANSHVLSKHATPNQTFFLVPNIWVQAPKHWVLQKSSRTSTTIFFLCRRTWAFLKGYGMPPNNLLEMVPSGKKPKLNFRVHDFGTYPSMAPWWFSGGNLAGDTDILSSGSCSSTRCIYTRKLIGQPSKHGQKMFPNVDSWWVQTSQQLNHLREFPYYSAARARLPLVLYSNRKFSLVFSLTREGSKGLNTLWLGKALYPTHKISSHVGRPTLVGTKSFSAMMCLLENWKRMVEIKFYLLLSGKFKYYSLKFMQIANFFEQHMYSMFYNLTSLLADFGSICWQHSEVSYLD